MSNVYDSIPESIGVEDYGYKFYQVIPDRAFKNDNNGVIARAIHDMYQVEYKRIHKQEGSILYTQQQKFVFRIVMTKDSIDFYIGVPVIKNWDDYLIKKCKNTWIKSSVLPVDSSIFALNVDKTEICELKYKRHHIFSIRTDKNEMTFYDSLLSHSNELGHGDKIVITYLIQPMNQRDWQDRSAEAYNKFKNGFMPRKLEINGRSILVNTLRLAESVLLEAKDFIEGLLDSPSETKASPDGEVSDLLVNGKLSSSTTKKLSDKPFKVKMYVCTQHKNAFAMNRSICNSYYLWSEDNELEIREMNKVQQIRSLSKLESYNWGLDLNANIMSLDEISKLICLPTVSIQNKYSKMSQNRQKEVDIPSTLFTPGGIEFCTVRDRGTDRKVYAPSKDIDILCQSHIDLGVKGSGKTTRGMNYAVNWLSQLKYSAFAIDVADGKLIDGIRDGLPLGFPEDHIIDLDFGNGEYPIGLNWSELGSKGTVGYKGRQVSNRLSQALFEFVNGVSTKDTTDRMERYLTAVSKACMIQPNSSLLDVFLGLTSKKFRNELMFKTSDPMVKEQLNQLNQFSPDMLKQVVQPILDRIHVLTNGDIMEYCLFQSVKTGDDGLPLMNFRKWADGDGRPYFVGIRVPKEQLMSTTTDRLVTYIVYKYWLSIMSRYDEPEEKRRPCLLIMDEPHQFMSCKMVWEQMMREDRKWRSKSNFLAHNFRDFGDLTKTFQDVGIQYSVFHSSKQTYKDLLEELSPFTLEELMMIPERYYAVNKLKGTDESIPTFLGKMPPPPPKIKDRSYLRDRCSKTYGRSFEEVERDIEYKKSVF
jgi:hypothetical protein